MSESATPPLARRAEELRSHLRTIEPELLARSTGADYVRLTPAGGEFHFDWWSRPVRLTFPELIAYDRAHGKPLPLLEQTLLLYYFHDSDPTPVAGEWIAFTELPDGSLYTRAFQGYTGQEILRHFGEDFQTLRQAALALGARPVPFADMAFLFSVLPRVALLLACWRGDEDFSPSYRILFDAAVSHHLPTEACAILGSLLTRKLITHDQHRVSHHETGD